MAISCSRLQCLLYLNIQVERLRLSFRLMRRAGMHPKYIHVETSVPKQPGIRQKYRIPSNNTIKAKAIRISNPEIIAPSTVYPCARSQSLSGSTTSPSLISSHFSSRSKSSSLTGTQSHHLRYRIPDSWPWIWYPSHSFRIFLTTLRACIVTVRVSS